jgi:Uncharacterised protein family (UPF0158)
MTDQMLERETAYTKLAEVAGWLSAHGQSARSASVKPRLQGTLVGFDEQRLGFRNFRAFLTAAAEAGHVVLRPVASGPDVDVLPVNAPASGQYASANRMRRDFWLAFVDWRSGWDRLYDRERDAVGWLPTHASADEASQYAELRHAQADDAKRFVPILPIDRETTLGWIRDFVGSRDGVERETLERALEAQRPIQAFVAAARETSLIEEWSAARLSEVRRRVEAWMRENDLTVDLDHERQPLSLPKRRASASSASHRVGDDELRARVLEAVRRMSRGELLRLAIPVEYILGD